MFKVSVVVLVTFLAFMIMVQAKPIKKKPKASKICTYKGRYLKPCYKVVRSFIVKNKPGGFNDKYEERKYASSWWVSTGVTVNANTNITSKVTRNLYFRLWNYTRENNIKRTVPVLYTIEFSNGQKEFSMSFYLDFPTSRNPPSPRDTCLRLEKEDWTVYVRTIKGLDHRERFNIKHAEKLSKVLTKHGLKGKFIAHDVMYMAAAYDPVWIPPMDRTNEFWLEKTPENTN